jgi:hypothetical protein
MEPKVSWLLLLLLLLFYQILFISHRCPKTRRTLSFHLLSLPRVQHSSLIQSLILEKLVLNEKRAFGSKYLCGGCVGKENHKKKANFSLLDQFVLGSRHQSPPLPNTNLNAARQVYQHLPFILKHTYKTLV